MSLYNGTPLTVSEMTDLSARAGEIVDQYNDKAAGLSGTAYSSGIRLWTTPDGPRLEFPKTLDDARRLARQARSRVSPSL